MSEIIFEVQIQTTSNLFYLLFLAEGGQNRARHRAFYWTIAFKNLATLFENQKLW